MALQVVDSPTLQGSSPNLQGSSPNLQGSSSSLQGSSPSVQNTTASSALANTPANVPANTAPTGTTSVPVVVTAANAQQDLINKQANLNAISAGMTAQQQNNQINQANQTAANANTNVNASSPSTTLDDIKKQISQTPTEATYEDYAKLNPNLVYTTPAGQFTGAQIQNGALPKMYPLDQIKDYNGNPIGSTTSTQIGRASCRERV